MAVRRRKKKRVVRRRKNPARALVVANPRRRRVRRRKPKTQIRYRTRYVTRKAPVRRRRRRKPARQRRAVVRHMVVRNPTRRRRKRVNPTGDFIKKAIAGGVGFIVADKMTEYAANMFPSFAMSKWFGLAIKGIGAFAMWRYGSKLVPLPYARAASIGMAASCVKEAVAQFMPSILEPSVATSGLVFAGPATSGLLLPGERRVMGALVDADVRTMPQHYNVYDGYSSEYLAY